MAQLLTLLECHHIQLNLRALIEFSYTTINQQISFWLCIFTIWVL